MSNARNSEFNMNIHGLRGFAALSVFLFHVYDMSRKQGIIAADSLSPLMKLCVLSLSAGVDLFFMISGYLITASIIRHANVRAFLLDRVARIYPVFLFLHLCLFGAAIFVTRPLMDGVEPGTMPLHFFSNLFLLPGIIHHIPLMQRNAWSLSLEFAFYIYSAAVYVMWRRQRMVAWILLGVAMPLLIWLYPRAAYFAVGTAIYFLVNRSATRTQAWPYLGVVSFLPFFAIMGYAFSVENLHLVWFAVPFGFALFLDVVRGAPAFALMLQNRWMQFMGTISYSFYLWHPIVTFPLKQLASKPTIAGIDLSANLRVTLFGVTAFLLSLFVSYLSWLLLEGLVGKRVRHWLKPKAPLLVKFETSNRLYRHNDREL